MKLFNHTEFNKYQMGKMQKNIFIYSIRILFVLIILFGGFLIFATICDFHPPFKTSLGIKRHIVPEIIDKKELTLISWNIGYSGLGEEMDFFYEGGSKMRPSLTVYQEYLNSIHFHLRHFDTVDFMLLQEVDQLARRSYYFDQEKSFSDALINKENVFAFNYNVPYVPIPVFNPMARVKSGMQLFSEYKFKKAVRYGFPVNYKWPLKLFMLDRCFIYSSFLVNDKKKLILLNIHNSAFDNADELREIELMMIKGIMIEAYQNGDYVIAGGDWNQNPVGYNPEKAEPAYKAIRINKLLREDYFPKGWQWVFDSLHPTNRDVSKPYKAGETNTTTIDYYIVSPNVEVVDKHIIDLEFQFSDHQPVYLKVKLNEIDTLKNP